MFEDLFPWEEADTESPSKHQEETEEITPQGPPGPEPSADPLTPTDTEDYSKQQWNALVKYHEMGLSMIWGRAEDEIVKSGIKKAKTPIVTSWSSEPEHRFTLDALSKMMIKANAKIKIAPIIICGKASGNLVVIDVDNKHWPGIDVRYFTAIRETFPELWAILRIHRTPSGGFHLFYRTILFVPMEKSNPKLAWKKDETEAGIESRTHGGYVMAPPGMGYEVYRDVPIPTISVEDHERLFALARMLNEKVTIKDIPKQKTYESNYDTNPFNDFNSSPAAEMVLANNGWDIYKETSEFVQYTRPGKDSGVSASYIKSKRLYHVFTSSTDIEPETFTPAFLRSKLEFDSDFKKMYAALVHEGYGRHKPDYEEKYIRKFAEKGQALPPNFSPEAQEQLKTILAQKDTKYPHGIFWEYDPTSDSYDIQREHLSKFNYNIGLRLHNGEPVIIDGQFIRKLKESKKRNGDRDAYKLIKSWIREEDTDAHDKIAHEFDKFWQQSGEHTITTLSLLDKNRLLRSNPNASYKCFRNGILTITKGEIRLGSFDDSLDKLIWADDIIDRDWNYVDQDAQEKAMFGDFLGKAVGGNPAYVRLVLGYLCCGYKVKSESYLIAFMEGLAVSKGGGTGKNFLFEMLGLWIGALTINGMAVKKDVDQLIQSWNGEPLVHLSDLPKWVNLSDLKNVVSDNSQRKVLWQNIANVMAEDMPKFVISGQFGLNTDDDGGVKGRVRQLSFTGYFSRLGKDIRGEYGGDCPDVWTDADWDGYYSYIADSIKEYLGVRRLMIVDDIILWRKGWDARFSGGESWLGDAIDLKYEDWARLDYVTGIQRGEWYEDVCRSCNIPASGRIRGGNSRLSQALKEYGEKMELFRYETGGREYVDGKQEYVVRIILTGEKDDGGGEVPF